MQIGFNLSISGPLSATETLVQIARHGETMGYDYLTLTDHTVLPNLRVPGYPMAATPSSRSASRSSTMSVVPPENSRRSPSEALSSIASP
jgi:alkanesulfonate monooxygenase SsuD/methylene tetrahydromethanopterin reductase-like flavin-dependent oxidoreductase (luciferase family)